MVGSVDGWRTLCSMDRSFWALLWESLKSVYSAIIGIASLVVSVVLWLYVPDTQASLRVIVPLTILVLVLLLAAVVTLLNAALEANREANAERRNYEAVQAEYNDYKARGGGGLPRVIEGRNPLPGTEAALLCILDPSELFSYDTMVSFFSVSRQGVEVLVGIGFVTHVQDDRKIHATMMLVEDGQEDFAERLRQNESEAVRTTLVKPGFPRRYTSF